MTTNETKVMFTLVLISMFSLLLGNKLIAQHVQFTVGEVFKLEDFGSDMNMSPNQKYFSFSVQRPLDGAKHYDQPYLRDKDRSDVYVYSTETKRVKKITHGEETNEGFWNPLWSPNGDKALIFSTYNTENISLWLWEESKSQLSLVSDNAFYLSDFSINEAVVWLSNDQFMYSVQPENSERVGGRNIMKLKPKVATKGWEQMANGEEPTYSILDSGETTIYRDGDFGTLYQYDCLSGEAIALDQGLYRKLLHSPKSNNVVTIVTEGIPKFSKDLLVSQTSQNLIGIKILKGDYTVDSTLIKRFYSVLHNSVLLSESGNQLVFQGALTPDDERPKQLTSYLNTMAWVKGFPSDLYVYNIDKQKLNAINLPKEILSVSEHSGQVHYSASRYNERRLFCKWWQDKLIVYLTSGKDKKRNDWWLWDKGEWTNITKTMEIVPADWVITANDELVGTANGDLWRIRTNHRIENLTENIDQFILSINKGNDNAKQLILNLKHNKLAHFNISTKNLTPITKPHPDANPVAFSEKSGEVFYKLEDNTGSFLWAQNYEVKNVTEPIIKLNEFLKNIKPSKALKIEYISLNGETLTGHLYLPTNYKEGTKVPLITWVYLGHEKHGEPRFTFNTNNPVANKQIYLSKGYAWLEPSMPSTQADYLALDDGVIPAVDKVVDMGIADPNKLIVAGQSGGGYSTYGLITQTNKFKCAIAMAGMSDLISLYGQFDPRTFYEDDTQERMFQSFYIETGLHGTGALPWKNPWAYIQNSPLFYADRVETPILIIQGDLDYIPITQGEEFYKALYRQGKKARFLRFWGEGHLIRRPANTKKMYEEIFRWLEENNCSPKLDSYNQVDEN